MDFNEENIAAIFGHEAAEDEDIDRLKSYYLKGNTFSQIVTDLPIRLLVGHKGIGKSALFHVAMDEERAAGKLAILIKPDDITGIGETETDFLKLIREWKIGISEIISRKALISFGTAFDGWRSKLNEYGGKFIDFLQTTLRADKYANLDASKKLILEQFLKGGRIYVYLDDLDRGWEGKRQDIRKISALLNAIRDMASETKGVSFRVSLRSDVYYLVRTSDESTDKIEGSVIWQSWTNHEILALLVKRIEQYFNRSHQTKELIAKSQPALANYLHSVIEPYFEGKGHWSHIPTYRMLMSLVRKRPRDLVKLCTLAARDAKENGSDLIGTENFNEIFESYSQGRLQDTFNEYKSELPDIDRLLFGMKPSKQEKRTSSGYTYTTDALLKKIENIQQGGQFKFANGSIADKKALAAFMYKINFLTARKEVGEYIERKYFEENRYLSNKFADFGYDWEVHPAYRWALQPDDFNGALAQIKPTAD
ncbi:P-loop ATPase, Sll1717 family [Cupriavidus pinatubonensis]|uniref:P-loop ATPase, Sll1717 family n=1 Tax=Cupriavidus pinatubonensis TaxID=248026 RepID=UPI00361DB446